MKPKNYSEFLNEENTFIDNVRTNGVYLDVVHSALDLAIED